MVYVHVHAFNTGAIRLYKDLGFKVGTGRGNGDGGDGPEFLLPVDGAGSCNSVPSSASIHTGAAVSAMDFGFRGGLASSFMEWNAVPPEAKILGASTLERHYASDTCPVSVRTCVQAVCRCLVRGSMLRSLDCLPTHCE